jgi:N-acetylglucosaminyl-diphospho-decaprenol L-rhamnosyltransferase
MVRVDLSVSIVHMYHLEQTCACLRSIFVGTHKTSLEVFVIDNSCRDADGQLVLDEFPQVTLIRNTASAGFSTNHNKALSRATGRYLCILNDDTIVQNGAFDTLVTLMDEYPEAGACGPKLIKPDGGNQPAFSNFTNPIEELLVMPLLLRFAPQQWDVSNLVSTDWIGGACMIVRKTTTDQVGLLDPRFDPVYAEERDWCYRIKQAGWQVYHVPTAQVMHLEGESTKYNSEAMILQLYRNKLAFYEKHTNPMTVLQYRVVLFLLSSFKVLKDFLLLPITRCRDCARKHLMIDWRLAQLSLSGK